MRRVLHQLWNGITRVARGGLLASFDVFVLGRHRRDTRRGEGAIFCLHGLGDLVLAGKAIERLSTMMRERGLRAVLYVHPTLVSFAQGHLDVDAVEGIDRHRFSKPSRYRAVVLKQIANRFEIAVQPTYNRMMRVEDFLMRATGARERIGSAGHAPFITPLERLIGDRFYTRLVPQMATPIHELSRYAEFMKGIELPIPARPWKLEAKRPAPVDLPEPYVIVCPAASAPKRSWPRAKFMQTAAEVSRKYGVAIVVIGIGIDAEKVTWDAAGLPPLVDLQGKTKTDELPALLAGAKLVLSNDSGLYHLGIALGVPTVAVGGSGIPDRYFPYADEASLRTKALFKPVECAGCNWKCRYRIVGNAAAPCVESVEWQMVAEAIDAVWNGASAGLKGLPVANCVGHRHL